MASQVGTLELSVTVGDAAFSASGETAVVLETYADFKKLLGGPRPVHPPKRGTTAPEFEAGSDDAPPAAPERHTNLPLKPYLEQFKLKGNKEKATAILAWSAESGEKTALTVSEVEKLWKRTPFKLPTKLARDLRAAEGEGWLDSQGKSGSPNATFSINGYGEGIVAGWASNKKD